MEQTATAPKKNLFAAGTKVKEPASKKVEKKVISAPNLEDKVQKFLKLKEDIERMTGEQKMLEGDIKTVGRNLFISEYKAQKSTPENFKIADATGSSCMFIVMDKYTVVDPTKAEFIKGCYPDAAIVSEKTVYTLNAELVEKYGEIISDLISNCPDISEDDKGNLIAGELAYSIAKGTIDRLLIHEQQTPEQLMELVNPICMLKK